MSVIQPHHRPLQQFFRSGPMPCPYLPGRVERKLFTRLLGPYSAEVNSTLSRAGFRRSHDIVYRPVCPNCQACVPVRIPVATFQPSRSQKRVARINQDLYIHEAPAMATAAAPAGPARPTQAAANVEGYVLEPRASTPVQPGPHDVWPWVLAAAAIFAAGCARRPRW